jgi:hypothetical protein
MKSDRNFVTNSFFVAGYLRNALRLRTVQYEVLLNRKFNFHRKLKNLIN